MGQTQHCSQCGAALPGDAMDGLCPKCMARVVFGEVSDVKPAAAGPPTLHSQPDGEAELEGAGVLIGRYKLLEQIGEGGFGLVYMAEQVEPVQRKVALKIIKAGMDSKQVVARFEAERQALALMDHPNIATVLDAGTTTAGRPYFVMELVRGVPVTEFCDTQQLSTPDRLNLLIKVCQAVQHAHQKGIIHRDLKPSNVLVTLHDGEPVPKVIDFGVAKALGHKLTEKTLFTGFAHLIGTPAYMSPEQAQLSGLDVDTRSDIYSLGVLLYELLTGVTPFEPEVLAKAALDEIRRMIRETEPPKPSTRLRTLGAKLTEIAHRRGTEPAALSRLVRGDLDWIVMKCLEKDRRRRYETANGVAMDIQRHLQCEPVVARPPSRLYRVQKSIGRNKLAYAASAAVAAAIVVGLGVSTILFFKEKESRRRADAAAANNEQVAQFLKDMLEGVRPEAAMGQDTRMLRKILDRTVQRVGEELKGQPEVEAELRNTLGQVYLAIGEFGPAEEQHRAALALREKVFGPEHPEVAVSLDGLALALVRKGSVAEAEQLLNRALTLQKRLLPKDHIQTAQTLNDLAIALQNSGDPQKFPQAEQLQLEAIAMLRRLVKEDDKHVAMTVNNLAVLIAQQGRWNEAALKQQEALALQRKLLEPDHPDIGESLNNLSVMLLNSGDLADAETAARDAVALRKKVLAPEHCFIATSLNNLASTLWQQSKLEDAEKYQREAADIQIKATSSTNLESLKYLNNLGTILTDQGKFTEAEATHRQVLAARTNLFGTDSAPVAESLNNLARALCDQGQFAVAEEFHQRASEILSSLLDPKHPTVSAALANLAAVQGAQKKYADAETNHLKALALRRALPKKYNFLVAQSLNSLGLLYREAGRLRDAESGLLEALTICRELPSHQELLLAATLENLVLVRRDQSRLAEAETWARDCRDIRERRLPGKWRLFHAQALLGLTLLAQGRAPEAEPLLQSGCQGMKAQLERMPAPSKARYWEAVESVADLSDETTRPTEATERGRKLKPLENP